LRQAHKIETLVLTADLARPEIPARVFKELQGRGIKVDILVNNAGFGANGAFARMPLSRTARNDSSQHHRGSRT